MASNEIRHKIVISGEAEYKKAMGDMNAQLREAKSAVKAAAAEMQSQGKTTDTLTAQIEALTRQGDKQNEMLLAMQQHLKDVEEATGNESREAINLRTRINALRADIAQTNGQLGTLTSELGSAAEAAKDLGSSDAAQGILGLGDAAQGAMSETSGLLGSLSSLGQGFTIGMGVQLAKGALEAITGGIKAAAELGFAEAVADQKQYNSLGIATGTAGTPMNDYMMGVSERFLLRNPGQSAGDAQAAIASAYTYLPQEVFENEERLLNLLNASVAPAQALGTSVAGMIENMRQLNTVMGTDFEDAIAILTNLGQGKAGAQGVNTLMEYALTFKQAGMDAAQAAGALEAGADKGILKAGDMGRAIQEASNFLSNFADNEKDLKGMGLRAKDMGQKFQEGGEMAAASLQLLMSRFMDLSPDKQGKLGSKIFGSEGWKRYGSTLAEAIADGYEATLTPEMRERIEKMQEALYNDLDSQKAITVNLASDVAGKIWDPIEYGWTQILKGGNEAALDARDRGGYKDGYALGKAEGEAFIQGALAAADEVARQQGEAYMTSEYGEDWRKIMDDPLAYIFKRPETGEGEDGASASYQAGADAGEQAAAEFREGMYTAASAALMTGDPENAMAMIRKAREELFATGDAEDTDDVSGAKGRTEGTIAGRLYQSGLFDGAIEAAAEGDAEKSRTLADAALNALYAPGEDENGGATVSPAETMGLAAGEASMEDYIDALFLAADKELAKQTAEGDARASALLETALGLLFEQQESDADLGSVGTTEGTEAGDQAMQDYVAALFASAELALQHGNPMAAQALMDKATGLLFEQQESDADLGSVGTTEGTEAGDQAMSDYVDALFAAAGLAVEQGKPQVAQALMDQAMSLLFERQLTDAELGSLGTTEGTAAGDAAMQDYVDALFAAAELAIRMDNPQQAQALLDKAEALLFTKNTETTAEETGDSAGQVAGKAAGTAAADAYYKAMLAAAQEAMAAGDSEGAAALVKAAREQLFNTGTADAGDTTSGAAGTTAGDAAANAYYDAMVAAVQTKLGTANNEQAQSFIETAVGSLFDADAAGRTAGTDAGGSYYTALMTAAQAALAVGNTEQAANLVAQAVRTTFDTGDNGAHAVEEAAKAGGRDGALAGYAYAQALNEAAEASRDAGNLEEAFQLADQAAIAQQQAALQAYAAMLVGDVGDTMVDAVTDAGDQAESEIAARGETLGAQALEKGQAVGESGVTGAETGLSGMEGAAQGSVDGLIAVLDTAADQAYDSGYAAGKAFESGYADAQSVHSPSRVMQRLAAYSLQGLTDTLDAGTMDLSARGAALGDALRSGYASRGALSAPGMGGGASQTAAEQAEAMRQALDGMAVLIDGERAGELVETSVSRASYARSAGTIAGRGSAARSW